MENPKTQDVVRLDYSRPPPEWVESGVATVGGQTYPAVEPGGRARRRPVQYAWVNYKNENDPPGGEIVGHSEGWAFVFLDRDNEAIGNYYMPYEARAAAWAWYDCRLGLAEKWQRIYDTDGDARQLAAVRYRGADDETAFDNWWPRCLAWSSEQVANVERWLSDSTVETPGVLRV